MDVKPSFDDPQLLPYIQLQIESRELFPTVAVAVLNWTDRSLFGLVLKRSLVA
jgi:hypothetical protein